MTKKRFLVLFFIACVTMVGALALTTQRGDDRQATVPPKNPPSIASLSPTLPASLPMGDSVQHDTSRLDISLPPTVAVYQTTPRPATPAQAQTIARTLGVTTEPTTEATPQGPFFFFLSGNTSVAIGPDMSHISLSVEQAPSEGGLRQTDMAFITLAQAALAKTSLLPKDITLSAPEIVYFVPEGAHREPVPRAQATVIQLTFHPVLDAIPFSMGYPEDSAVTFQYDGEGKLLSFSSPIFPVISKTKDVAALISLGEAKTRLSAGEGRLLDVRTGVETELEAASDLVIPTTTVTSGMLSLFWDPKQSVLTPVFLFTGAARDEETGASIATTTLVSALP